jgi:hypothetical protein
MQKDILLYITGKARMKKDSEIAGFLVWRKISKNYVTYCIKCFNKTLYSREKRRFRFWDIRKNDLGDFSQLCRVCEKNLNPEARFSCQLFTETKFVDDGYGGYFMEKILRLPAPLTIERMTIPIDLLEGTGL